jgi:hypothetical protein
LPFGDRPGAIDDAVGCRDIGGLLPEIGR